jgi:4-amino-4-deoxy-L-arabinose transferase-like glycosyltransferase
MMSKKTIYLTNLYADKNQIIFFMICLFAIVLNIYTLEWYPLPWVDDISLVDSPVNFVLDGEWRTTAVFGDKDGDVYSLYPPLYQFILIPFIWLFGASPISCKSLNVLLVFGFCLIAYRLFRKTQVIKNYYPVIFFLLLVWCADTFSWIYRNGRPDILNMACVAGFLISYYKGKNNWRLILFSFLIITSGIQACPYILGILICIYFLHSDKRKAKKGIYLFIIGSLSGLLFISIYFYLQGHLLSFYYRTFFSSSSAKSLVSLLLPYIEIILPMDMSIKEALSKQTAESTSFFKNLIEAYTINKEYIVLCVVNGLMCLGLTIKKKIIFKSTEAKLLLVSIAIPAMMSIAGRFAIYYTWMCYLPAVLCSAYIVGKHSKSIDIPIVYGFATLFIVSFGLPNTLITSDRNVYHRIETFVQKQNFSDKDKIISPFMSYYAIRNITKTCYFTGTYPLSLVPEDTKYILTAKDDYGNENMDIYLKYCKSVGKKISAIDSLNFPQMMLYIVE